LFALVTGAGGFLGRYIAEQLVARGDRVRGFSRRAYPELTALGIETVTGDLRDGEQVAAACEGVDLVFHVAGVAGIWGPWEHFHCINTEGTEHVIAGCQRHAVPRMVYTSSPSVTFDGGDQLGIDETAPYPTKWLCHYPHTKALGEQAVLAANGVDGLATCALRPHLIWGPRDQHLIPRLLERARRGKLVRIGDGRNLVDMIYVENAANAHLLAGDALQLGAPVAGKAYFISQCQPVNCWEWIDQILVSAGQSPVKRAISFKAAWHVGSAMETFYCLFGLRTEPRMTRFLASQLAKSHYFDVTAACQDFGYTPTITTQEGMRRLAESLTSPT